jgi:AbrB family looped-hinge helix DNA binding protein
MGNRQVLLEYLATTKIGEKGQLTIPKQFRDGQGLGAGAPFVVLRLGDGLILLPEQQRFHRLCEEISASLTKGGVSPEALLATLPQTRRRLFERRYGASAATASEVHGRSRGDRKR